MKPTTLCIVLLLSSSSLMAEDLSREEAKCRELVASVRPPLSEGEEGKQYLESADEAYRDCRGAKLPLEIRAQALFKYGIATATRQREQASIAALREAIDLLDHAGSGQTDLLVAILDYVAFVESRAGLQVDATFHAKKAVDVRAKTFGRNSAQAAEGMVHLAMVHVTFNEYAKTEALLRDAIRIAEKACGPQCDVLVSAYAGMETLYETQGKREEAKRYSELGQNAVPTRGRKD
jgi:hypothetical protein